MKLYYGAAIQGSKDRTERVHIHRMFTQVIKDRGHQVVTEHTNGMNKDEVAKILEASFGPLPPLGPQRTAFIRDKMIESVEGDIDAAIFEVSIPSLGTGIEIAHTYLRPRMGLREIPILALYQKDYWPNKLSSMILGITPDAVPQFKLHEYENVDQAQSIIGKFLESFARHA